MWLVIIVGLFILILPFLIDIFSWLLAISVIIIIASWFFHSLIWILLFLAVAIGGQKLIDNHYIKTGKGKFWISNKLKNKINEQ